MSVVLVPVRIICIKSFLIQKSTLLQSAVHCKCLILQSSSRERWPDFHQFSSALSYNYIFSLFANISIPSYDLHPLSMQRSLLKWLSDVSTCLDKCLLHLVQSKSVTELFYSIVPYVSAMRRQKIIKVLISPRGFAMCD